MDHLPNTGVCREEVRKKEEGGGEEGGEGKSEGEKEGGGGCLATIFLGEGGRDGT